MIILQTLFSVVLLGALALAIATAIQPSLVVFVACCLVCVATFEVIRRIAFSLQRDEALAERWKGANYLFWVVTALSFAALWKFADIRPQQVKTTFASVFQNTSAGGTEDDKAPDEVEGSPPKSSTDDIRVEESPKTKPDEGSQGDHPYEKIPQADRERFKAVLDGYRGCLLG